MNLLYVLLTNFHVSLQEKSIIQTVSAQVHLQPMEIKCPLIATPNTQQSCTETIILTTASNSQNESKSTAVSLDEIIASTSETLPLKVAQIEVELSPVSEMETFASTSEALKVAEPEACSQETVRVVAEHEAVCSFYFYVCIGNVLS